MSRYTGRSLVVVALCLCFVVVHAVRDFHSSYCSFTPEELRGSSLVTWFQQPGGKICLRMMAGIDDEKDLPLFRSLWMLIWILILWMFFFLDAVNFFSFLMILLSGKISLWMFVLRDDGNVDRRRWATVLSSFMDIMVFLIYREWFNRGGRDFIN